MQIAQCPSGTQNTNCQAAFLGIHLTPGSSAYLQVTISWHISHTIFLKSSPTGHLGVDC